MAAEPVPERQLATLHERISRDVAELRSRMRRVIGDRRGSPDDVLRGVIDAFRVLRALRGLAPGAGLAVVMVAGLAARLKARRRSRRDYGGGPGVRGL